MAESENSAQIADILRGLPKLEIYNTLPYNSNCAYLAKKLNKDP